MTRRRRARRHDVIATANAIREVGVLFFALAPLDAAFTPPFSGTLLSSLIFVLLGISFFLISLKLERSNGP